MADDGAQPLSVSPRDRDLWIRTVIGEAAGDPSALAVAHVIANRARNSGSSVRDVVLAPNQFEPWSKRSRELMSYTQDDPAYKQAANIVDAVSSGRAPDPTNGATKFYAPVAQAQLGRKPPKWDDGTGQQIGAHKFFGGGKPNMDLFDADWGTAPTATGKASDGTPQSLELFDADWGNQPTQAAGGKNAAPAPTPVQDESIDFLSNSPTDKDEPASALAKGAGTTAIKAV